VAVPGAMPAEKGSNEREGGAPSGIIEFFFKSQKNFLIFGDKGTLKFIKSFV
jgi:hypothetical protein